MKSDEAAAKTQDEKDTIKARREALERVPDLNVTAMAEATNLSNRTLAIYGYAEGIAGMVLNVLMIVSGIGLLLLHEWGRRLALGVAWLKILRWVTIVVATMVLIVPITTQMQQKMFESMNAQIKAQGGGRAPMPMTGLAQASAVMGAASAVFSALVAVIYPVLELWFLTRPRTLAVFLARSKPPSPAPGPDTWTTS